jgi:hypothetical protein
MLASIPPTRSIQPVASGEARNAANTGKPLGLSPRSLRSRRARQRLHHRTSQRHIQAQPYPVTGNSQGDSSGLQSPPRRAGHCSGLSASKQFAVSCRLADWTNNSTPQGGRPAEFGPQRDTRKPSTIRTYAVQPSHSIIGGSCGVTGRIISTWKGLAGRVTPDGLHRDFRPLPEVRTGATPSRRNGNGLAGHPMARSAPRAPGDGTGPGAFEVRPQLTKCDWCGVQFSSLARRSSNRPKLFCPEHRNRANRLQAVAG